MKKVRDGKSKRIQKINPEDRPNAVAYGSKIHGEAFNFRMLVHIGLIQKHNPNGLSALGRPRYELAVEMLSEMFLDAYGTKNGEFFRALADVMERDESPEWTALEKYVSAKCVIMLGMDGRLPYADEILRGWKIFCCVVPTDAAEQKDLWELMIGGAIPKSHAEIEKRLRNWMGQPMRDLADIQINQIQRAAKYVGYSLPTRKTANK